MGWKNVRDHYRIGHIVKVVDGSLHFGSPYVGDLVRVTPDGVATINRTFADAPELQRYRNEINADPAKFRELMAAADVFAVSIPVYTWSNGEILEKFCEEFGWPNVTHDGELMYDNRFYLERDRAIEKARSDAASTVEAYERLVVEAREKLTEREGWLAEALAHRAAFDALPLAADAAAEPA